MKVMFRAIPFPAIIATLALASCATVSKIGEGSVSFVQKTVNTINPRGVKVVEVREKDLKPRPTGKEQALAYENTRKRGFWSFLGPVDFKEPTLPADGGELDGSLLPPKTP